MSEPRDVSRRSAADFLPRRHTLPLLRRAAAKCRGCDLYRAATQTVFGEGPAKARVMIVGEQPGDQEDLQGHPFVGPSGKVLNDALEEAGLDRDEVYVTNAVKHFYFTTRLPRRQHKTPARRHVNACRPWLEAEIEVVRPEGIVCLGATAGQSLLGPTYRLTKDRGKFLKSEWAVWIVGTYHPSAILRAPTPEGRAKLRAYFVADLRKAAKRLG